MASINISEDDFVCVAAAANDALKRGDVEDAAALDKIARKINAALSNSNVHLTVLRRMTGRSGAAGPTWRDMPSTLMED
jgi:hypothetical protein